MTSSFLKKKKKNPIEFEEKNGLYGRTISRGIDWESLSYRQTQVISLSDTSIHLSDLPDSYNIWLSDTHRMHTSR